MRMEYEVIINKRTVYRGTDWNRATTEFQWYKENKNIMRINEIILMCAEEGFILEG